jgi:LmbE family N-acetylglucosaminyl deacetylase
MLIVFFDLDNLRAWKMRTGAHHQIFGLFDRAVAAGDLCVCATVTNTRSLSADATDGWHMLRGVPVFETLVPDNAKHGPAPFRAAIARMIAACPADVAIVLAPSDWVSETEIWLLEALAETGMASIVLVADERFPTARTYGTLFPRYAKATSDMQVWVPSHFIAKQIRTVWGREARISPNLFAPVPETPLDGPDALHDCKADRLTLINPHPSKGSAIFEALARHRPDWSYLTVDGWPDAGASVAESEAGCAAIKRLPFQADLTPVWRQTRVLVVLSLCAEAFGRVVIEAQSHGIPVIAHDIGGLPEAVGDGGLLLAPGDGAPDKQARALETALLELGCMDAAQMADRAKAHARRIIAQAEAQAQTMLAQLRGGPGARPRRQGTLILSPHSDDAAFSLGGALAGGHLPQPCTVLTLFGRSNYARGGFHPTEAIPRISTERRAEDQRWAEQTGVNLIYLDLPEAALRHGSHFDTIFAPIAPGDALPDTAERAIRDAVQRLDPALLLAPLALGGHRDHVLVQRAARALADGAGLGFYEDLPYAQEAPEAEHVAARGQALRSPAPATIWFEADEVRAKMRGVALYESQTDPALSANIECYSRALAGERIWVESGAWPWPRGAST